MPVNGVVAIIATLSGFVVGYILATISKWRH